MIKKFFFWFLLSAYFGGLFYSVLIGAALVYYSSKAGV